MCMTLMFPKHYSIGEGNTNGNIVYSEHKVGHNEV
jgi:hypothetical protein